jgi:hypothetical protein
LSPAATKQRSRGVRTHTEESQQLGPTSRDERLDPCIELAELVVEDLDPTGQRGDRGGGASGDRVSGLGRAQLGRFGDQDGDAEASEPRTKLVRGANDQMAHLDERGGAGHSGRALGHHECSDGLDCTVFGLGDGGGPSTEGGPSCLDGVERIGLAAATTLGPIRPVHLDDRDAGLAQEPRESRPIGARALHADLGDLPEALEPGQKRFVASRSGREGLASEQPSERIECSGNVDVEVGVDSAGHSAHRFYDGHGHPFSR